MYDQRDLERASYLEGELRKHDRLYYGEAKPVIPDSEYDRISMELRGLVESGRVPSDFYAKPGHDDRPKGYKEVKHLSPMISLRTEVDTGTKPLNDFIRRTREAGYTGDYVAEQKYDGVALALHWKDCQMTAAVLRGDGESGENVLENAIHISNLPPDLGRGYEGVTEIRGEVVLPRQLFDYVNRCRIADKKEEFVNCRNAAAGILRGSNSGKLLECLTFMPYGAKTNGIFETQSETLEWLGREFGVQPFRRCLDEQSLYRFYQDIEEQRDILDYDIDGIVYKVNDLDAQEGMGAVNREPRWAIAHKFAPEEVETTLEDIVAEVGQTGRITPVAAVSPVFVGGVTVTNVTLSNVFQIRRKGIRVGDKVIVRRAGDVIPEIVGRSGDYSRKTYVPNWHIPSKCPVCQGVVSRPKGQANYNCTNPECKAQLSGKLTHVAQRGILDIDGLGPVVAEAFVANGYDGISKVLSMTEEQITACGVGVSNSRKLYEEIQRVRSTPIPMDKAIRALAIPNIGEGASAKVAKYYPSPLMFLNWRKETVESIPELNKTEKANLLEYLETKSLEAEAVFKLLKVTKAQKFEGPLTGITVVFTGGDPEYGKAELKEIAKRAGADIGSSVSKTTGLVVFGRGAGEKLSKAGKLGIATQSTQDFVARYK